MFKLVNTVKNMTCFHLNNTIKKQDDIKINYTNDQGKNQLKSEANVVSTSESVSTWEALEFHCKEITSKIIKLQSKRNVFNKSKIDRQILFFGKIKKKLTEDLANYHSEVLTDRDKVLYKILSVNDPRVDELKEKLKENIISMNKFYNSLMDKFKNNKIDRKSLSLIEESFKHLTLGLMNQDASIIKNKTKEKLTEDQINKIKENHNYLYSLINNFEEIIKLESKTPVTEFFNKHKNELSEKKEYSDMHNELKILSRKESIKV